MRNLLEISRLTGYTLDAVKIYFRLVDWGLSDRDAARIAKVLEGLGFSSSFAEGLPWWMPRMDVELSLILGIVYGAGYIVSYVV